ncbi:MAG: polysulfide reductase NrfD [Nitrososphaerota archaeon]|nr:polysulfide reductase NrfD [Nitrososphaerota archaeon]
MEDSDAQAVLAPLRWHGPRFYLLASSLLALVLWGGYAFYVEYAQGLVVTGMRTPVSWGLNIVNFVYIIAISMSGTIISGILRLTNVGWRTPITRIAESITVMAVIVGALFPLLDLGRPERGLNLIVYARLQSPITWDTIAIGTYFVASLVYLYLPLIPDIAICRDSIPEASGLRKWVYRNMSLGWAGSPRQERTLKRSIKIMAVLVIPLAVSVHSALSWVFSNTLRDAWHSTVFPPFFVGGAIFSGLATIIIVMYFFRRAYHLEGQITGRHFVNLGRLMLVADLAMIYLTVSEYMAPSYVGETASLQYLSLIFTGQYAGYFWFMMVSGFLVPAFLTAFPRTARNADWVFLAAVLVDVGMWLERYLIVVPGLAVPQLQYPVGQYAPSWVDVSMTVAGLAGLALLLLLFSRLFPIVSLWETKDAETGAAPVRASAFTRRDFLRNGVVAAAGLAVGLGSFMPYSLPGRRWAPVELSALGEAVPPTSAGSHLEFSPMLPGYLPAGVVLKEARVASDGKMLTLVYSGPIPLETYGHDIAMVLFQVKETAIEGPPGYLPSNLVRTRVNGSEGFAEQGEPSQIQWWAGGRRCVLVADLPVAELGKVAASMGEA